MRTFIAIELPKNIKEALAALQDELKKSNADVKWVAPNNIHLTLKFLGEIDDKQLTQITKILEDSAKDTPVFSLRISCLGGFPKMDSPRIIWVGLDKGDEESKRIAQILEEKIEKLGIPKEDRPFSSHITIGRTRSSKNLKILVEEIKKLEGKFSCPEFPAAKITLYKSTLTPKGPIYEALIEASLKTT